MTPEEQRQLDLLAGRVKELDKEISDFFDVYYRLNFEDKEIFLKNIVMRNSNIVSDGKNGMKIGTDPLQKIGFFNATPVTQQGVISAPIGGAVVDTQARAAINQIITALHNLGFTA